MVVTPSLNFSSLYRGADYATSTDSVLVFTLAEGLPNLTDKSVNFNLALLGTLSTTITSAGSGSQVVELELTHEQTILLSAGNYTYSLTIHDGTTLFPDLAIGTLTLVSIPGLT